MSITNTQLVRRLGYEIQGQGIQENAVFPVATPACQVAIHGVT